MKNVQAVCECALVRFFRERWPWRHSLGVSPSRLAALVEQCGAKPWDSYAILRRMWRRHVCIACGWIADYAPREASVFEPGCGNGNNLLWLASRGFQHVSGADCDSAALRLCVALQKEMGLSFPVFEDDCLRPTYPTSRQDIILSVNWLYHIPGASLDIFLETYLQHLDDDGMIVCDVVDSAYNKEKDNIWHTRDRKKPVHERRPSEYTFRMSQAEVAETASRHGLRVARRARTYAVPQRMVYMLSR